MVRKRGERLTLAPGTRLGPYEISGSLGAGGMGEVYRAKDTRLGRTVAIKVLPPDFAADPERKRRFEQEARAVSALNHPSICALYDIGSAEVAGGGDAFAGKTLSIGSTPLTQAGFVSGTVPYMAPEQLEGRETDARTDIFACSARSG
jgi:serine/threonine protein kinase